MGIRHRTFRLAFKQRSSPRSFVAICGQVLRGIQVTLHL